MMMMPKGTPKWIQDMVAYEIIELCMKRTYRFEGIRLASLSKK